VGPDRPSQPMDKLISTINYITNRSTELKNKYTNALSAPVDFACVFCQSEEEYGELTKEIEKLGKIVEKTPSGFTYLLSNSIKTKAGPLKLVKIRKPDLRKERGDADFNTNYAKLKEKYLNDPRFELVKYATFEMLRLSDPCFDVMTCFSNVSKSKNLGIKLQ
jgi:hypothetical protein